MLTRSRLIIISNISRWTAGYVNVESRTVEARCHHNTNAMRMLRTRIWRRTENCMWCSSVVFERSVRARSASITCITHLYHSLYHSLVSLTCITHFSLYHSLTSNNTKHRYFKDVAVALLNSKREQIRNFNP